MIPLLDECFTGRTDTSTESTTFESRTEDITQTTTAESTPIDITTLELTVTSSEDSNVTTTPVLDTGNTTEMIITNWTVFSAQPEITTSEMTEDWTKDTTELTMITWTFNSTQSSTLRVTTPESTVERNLIIISVLIVIILIICVIIGLILSQRRLKTRIIPVKTQTYSRDSEMTRISSGFQSFI